MTRKWRHLTASHLEVAVEGRKLAYTVHFASYKAVDRRRRQSHDRKWCHVTPNAWSDPEVTSFGRKSPGSAYKGPKTAIYSTFYLLQGWSLQVEAVTWQKMTSCDLRWPEVTSFDWKSPKSGCRRPKTGIYCTFHFLQGCCSLVEAVTCQEKMSRDLSWPEVTWKWCHVTGSHLEVDVEGQKLAYTVHLTFTRLQLAGGGIHVTGNYVTWSQVIKSDREVTTFEQVTSKLLDRTKNWHILYISLFTRL